MIFEKKFQFNFFLNHMNTETLKSLNLHCLAYRRIRGEVTYKIVHQMYDSLTIEFLLQIDTNSNIHVYIFILHIYWLIFFLFGTKKTLMKRRVLWLSIYIILAFIFNFPFGSLNSD